MKSILNPSLEYVETKQIDKKDVGLENVQVYEIELLETQILVCLGKVNNEYVDDHNISIVRLYLIKPSKNIKKIKITTQIGLYEFTPEEMKLYASSYENAQVELENIQNQIPLIYTFVTKEYLSKFSSVSEEGKSIQELIEKKEEEEEEEDDEEKRDDDEEKRDDDEEKGDGDEEKGEDDDEEDKKQILIKSNLIDGSVPWVAFFFNDINYKIKPNEGGGDCFFASIVDAYDTISIKKTIDELRGLVADGYTLESYNHYKSVLEVYIKGIEEKRKEIVELNKTVKEKKKYVTEGVLTQEITKLTLKKELDDLDGERRAKIMELKEMDQDYKEALLDKTMPLDMISKVSSLEELRSVIRKRGDGYWADENAIAIIERELNIKMIVVDYQSYAQKDYSDVLTEIQKHVTLACNNSNELLTQTPEYYIILNYNRMIGHYELVKNKNNGIFNFEDLPESAKDKIVERCLELRSSGFSKIPDFVAYKEKKVGNIPTAKSDIVKGSEDADIDSQQAIKESIDGLFDESVMFTYYGNSADKKPGEGNHEVMDVNKMKDYKELRNYKDWRRKLSNDYKNKEMIISVNSEQYESISEFISSKKLNKGTIQQALASKFTLNDKLDMKSILLATKRAKLQQKQFKKEAIVSIDLMKLRKSLMEMK